MPKKKAKKKDSGKKSDSKKVKSTAAAKGESTKSSAKKTANKSAKKASAKKPAAKAAKAPARPTSPNAWRELFINFFEGKGCKRIPSDSLVPEGDKSLLFTGAGMNQFKPDFTGDLRHDTREATSSQKCIRLPDLENVGRTARHHTFFEMLGFFSFGSFFKEEAIKWIWEFYTSPDYAGIPIEKLRVSVYKEDDEAYELWKEFQPHLHEKGWIYRLGEDDNFWPAGCPSKGPNGVCGPCSELFVDLGEHLNKPELKGNDNPDNNGDRFMEIGNIVFTQFERSGPIPGEGTLTPLPQKNIDFGGGFERLMLVVENVRTTLDTSLFMPIRHRLRELALELGETQEPEQLSEYQKGCREEELAFSAPGGSKVKSIRHFADADIIREKRIADHIRAAVFVASDGVQPGPAQQGYVLRRIIRRAYRDGVKLGFTGPFLHKLVSTVVELYGEAPDYAALPSLNDALTSTIQLEEEQFDAKLARGMDMLLREERELDQNGEKVLSGARAFDLYSTHGLPIDVIKDVLNESGYDVDEAGFEAEFDRFKAQSRKTSVFSKDIFKRNKITSNIKEAQATEFLGYDYEEAEARVLNISHDVEVEGHEDAFQVVLDQTPFYAESGGQVSDTGELIRGGDRWRVIDVKKMDNYFVHYVEAIEVTHIQSRGGIKATKRVVDPTGEPLQIGDTVRAHVDRERRERIRANHSATHLMHSALRSILGNHVQQKGSLVDDGYLRFDFSHKDRVTPEQLNEIEQAVNLWIRDNNEVKTTLTSPEGAREAGAIMFFGEKYGKEVRMLSMGDVSCELCGGTHVRRTGDIGSFRIINETSVGAGVRRIEAVTGERALKAAQDERELVTNVAAMLKTPANELTDRIKHLLNEIRELKAGKKKSGGGGGASVDKMLSKAVEIVGVPALFYASKDTPMDGLLTIKDAIVETGKLEVVLLGGTDADKSSMILALSPKLVKQGLDAGKLLREILTILDGRGGGKPNLAKGGGKQPEKLGEALDYGRKVIEEALSKVAG